MKRKKHGQPTSSRIRPVSGYPKKTSRKKFALPSINVSLKNSTWVIIALLAGGFLGILTLFFVIKDDLQSFDKLEKIDPAIATQVYSADGELLHSFFTSNRAYTTYSDLPQNVIDALISTEDRNF